MKPAAIYVRVSTPEQAEGGDSIPAQRERLRKWAKEHGYQVVEEYVDAGESARVTDRPAFSRLIQDARAGKFEAVLVWKWDRFARNAEDATLYKAVLRRECGVQVISISDPPGEGPVGQLIERILDVVAEFQSLLTAEHVHNTLSYLAQQGRWVTKAPFGYRIGKDGKLEVVPEEAEVVRWIFEQYAQGVRLTHIVQALMAGKPNKSALRLRWETKTLHKMLRHPVYIGTARWNTHKVEVFRDAQGRSRKRLVPRSRDEWILVPNAHPAIVSEDVWKAVQARLDEREPVQKASSPWHMVKGLVRCAQCGGLMHMTTKTGKFAHNPRWECNRYYRIRPEERCYPLVWVYHSDLSEAVLYKLEQLVKGSGLKPEDIDVPRPSKAQVERRIQALEERRERLLQAYLAGVVELEDYKRHKEALDREIQEARESLQSPRVDLEKAQKALQEPAKFLYENWHAQPESEEQRAVLEATARQVISAIWVDRERKIIDPRWRFYSKE